MKREQINPHGFPADTNQMMNMETTAFKVSRMEKAYGHPFTATSGLRSMADHLRIYKEKAAKAGVPFDQSKVPLKSKHLFGEAVDVADLNGSIAQWAEDNDALMREIGVWFEARPATPGWLHIQIVPYASFKPGKSLWFMP